MLTYEERVKIIDSLREKTIKECKKCDEGGRNEAGEECTCMIVFRKKSIAIAAGIPSEYVNYSLKSYPGSDEFKNDKRVKQVKGWMNKYIKKMAENITHNVGLMIVGPYGTGKTALLSLCLKRALNIMFPTSGIYSTASDMILAAGAGRYDNREVVYSLSDFRSKAALFIDDLGKEFIIGSTGIVTDRSKFGMILDDILRARAAKGLITFMSTNYSVDQIGEEYGKSCLEAIKQSMKVIAFKQDYPNLRDISFNSAEARARRIYGE